MIIIPKSRLPISEPAKVALKKELKRGFISKQLCPSVPLHRKCRMDASMGNPFSMCSTRDFTKFKINCKECREEIATVYARDKTLADWRKLSYKCWHDRKYWYGLRSFNVNPKTQKLLFECCCTIEVRKTPSEFIIKETN